MSGYTHRNIWTARLLLAVAALLWAAACSQPPEPEPAPDIEAIVRAAVEEAMPADTPASTPDVQAIVAAGVEATMQALALTPTVTPTPTTTPTPTATPSPTGTPVPTSTPTPTATPTPVPTDTPTLTATPTPVPTDTPTPTSTPTPIPADTPTPTATPTPVPASTPTPTPTPAATLTPVPTSTLAPTVTPTPAPLPTGFGPTSGVLNHNLLDKLVPIFDSGTNVADFVVEATFTTPHSISRRGWSSGFILRTGNSRSHVVVIHRSGNWHHYLRRGAPEDDVTLQTGASPNIRSGKDVDNHVRVIASGETGWLFINGIYESVLDLSREEEAGSVGLLGAWFEGDEVPGRATPFSDFTVRPLLKAYGPQRGVIEHNPDDDLIDLRRTRVSLADGIIQARFFNPYSAQEGSWSSGFLMRNSGANEFHALVVKESGRWLHRVRMGDIQSTQRLANQASEHISTRPSGSNHIRVIVLGGEGWLFIDGAHVGNLDLSGLLMAGGVSAVAGYFTGDGIAGKATRFEGFTIYSLGEVGSSVPVEASTPAPLAPTATPAAVNTAAPAAATPVSSAAAAAIEPSKPIAGRDVTLTVQGLPPWQDVTVEFVDPLGRPAPWVSEDETHISRDGREVTTGHLFADERGTLRFVRIAALDGEGIWTVRITGSGSPMTVNYPVVDLQLSTLETKTVGVEFRTHRGQVSETYYSSRVPAALAVDVQAHLSHVIDSIEKRLGGSTGQVPDVYLVWGRESLRKTKEALGLELGFEDGFFWSGSPHPGIYVRADSFRSDVLRLITHEYVHLLLDEEYGDEEIPAWLNEGLAKYLEFELALEGPRSDRSRRGLYQSADTAVTKGRAGALFPLTSLESQRRWNSRTDEEEVSLQYAQSHMVVRYMVGTYGAGSAIDVVGKLAGADVDGAIRQVTGVTYAAFEEGFVQYLRAWQDPSREAVREYTTALQETLEGERQIRDRRNEALGLQLDYVRTLRPRDAPPMRCWPSTLAIWWSGSRGPTLLQPCTAFTTTRLHTWDGSRTGWTSSWTTPERKRSRNGSRPTA